MIKNSTILILLIITSCSSYEVVDVEELVVREEALKEGTEGRYREGVVYRVNSQKPFTGSAKSEYSNLVPDGYLKPKRGSGYGLGQLITFKDGKLNGPFVTRGNQKKILIKTNLKGAKIEGFFEEYYPNGQLKVKFKSKDGSVQGRYESYHNNGQLEVITDCNEKVPEYFAFEKYKKFDINGKEISAYYDRSVCIDARIFIFIMDRKNWVSMSSPFGKPHPDEKNKYPDV